jgi:hypothetical protein
MVISMFVTFKVRHALTFIKSFLYCSLIVETFDTRLLTLMKSAINKPNTHTQIREYFLATLYLVMKIHSGIPVSRHTKTRLPHRPASLFPFVRGKRRRRRRMTAQGTL